MLQNTASDQGLHCLPLTPAFLDRSTHSKMDLLKFHNKYGKEISYTNIKGKQGAHNGIHSPATP